MLGLIADDLTGAGDAAVQFAKRGWPTFLSLDASASLDSSESVIAVTTDARALGHDVAARRTEEALRRLIDAGIDRVFVKIDSTMRGSVQGQIAGALSAWRTRHPDARAIVCPAYPRMGRTVEANRLLVHGVPVERTAIGRDPVTPVTTSHMPALVPASPLIVTADAASDDDLDAVAASIASGGPAVIAVGSGGLAGALAAIWAKGSGEKGSGVISPGRPAKLHPTPFPPSPRILLLVSSLNPVSHAQAAALRAARPDVTMIVAPTERVRDTSVAAALAAEFAALAARERWDLFGLVGGDGARAVLRCLGASGIRIVDSLVEGVPLGVIAGGRADGTPVFTKAGGFGDEDALVRAVEAMQP